jgi:hypothetical protein
MSDTTSQFDQLSTSQAGKEVRINQLLDAVSPAALGGRRESTTTGLTWGFYGGDILVNGVPTTVANGTVSLTGSSTNYVGLSQAGAVVCTVTTRNPLHAPLYTVVTSAGAVTSYTDERSPDSIAVLTRGKATQALTTANVTITHAQAMCDMLEVTGALTAQRDLIVPLLRRQWNVFHNGTAFSLRVIGASGTGVVVNIGQRVVVECDGTNVYVPVAQPWVPLLSDSTARAIVLEDAGRILLHPSADTTARTWTIPANASVAFPVGTSLRIVNQNAGGVISIAITTDTMRLAGAGTTGTRSLAANGIAEAIKVTTTEWIISGTGLT